MVPEWDHIRYCYLELQQKFVALKVKIYREILATYKGSLEDKAGGARAPQHLYRLQGIVIEYTKIEQSDNSAHTYHMRWVGYALHSYKCPTT